MSWDDNRPTGTGQRRRPARPRPLAPLGKRGRATWAKVTAVHEDGTPVYVLRPDDLVSLEVGCRLLDRAVRWFLTSRPSRLDIGAEVERFKGVVQELGPQVPALLRGDEKKRLEKRTSELVKAGVAPDLAERASMLLDWFSLLDIVDIATDTGRAPTEVAPLYYVVSERFGIDAMLTKVTRLPRDDRWDSLARGALRDDLYAVLESLTRAVIEVSGDVSDPAAAWETWEKANKESIQRSKMALAAIRRLDHPNIAALSVALRTLRSVIRVGASS